MNEYLTRKYGDVFIDYFVPVFFSLSSEYFRKLDNEKRWQIYNNFVLDTCAGFEVGSLFVLVFRLFVYPKTQNDVFLTVLYILQVKSWYVHSIYMQNVFNRIYSKIHSPLNMLPIKVFAKGFERITSFLGKWARNELFQHQKNVEKKTV
eukprot:snap_masked-scaffold_5-processed-gene-20.80-mRNA-1 protein AED:1.00 eAED:1.00 QI:0/-1/0/0/-1/1/1/0/148